MCQFLERRQIREYRIYGAFGVAAGSPATQNSTRRPLPGRRARSQLQILGLRCASRRSAQVSAYATERVTSRSKFQETQAALLRPPHRSGADPRSARI